MLSIDVTAIATTIDRLISEPSTFYLRVVDLLNASFCAGSTAFYLFDEDTRRFSVIASAGGGFSLASQMQQHNPSVLLKSGLSSGPEFYLGSSENEPGVGNRTLSIISPINQPDGRLIGLIQMWESTGKWSIDKETLETCKLLASHVSLAVTILRQREETARVEYELGTLTTLSTALISSIDLEQLLGGVADDIVQVVGFTRCCIYLYDHKLGGYLPRVWRGYPETIGRNHATAGVIGSVGATRKAVHFDLARVVAREPHMSSDDLREAAKLKGFARSLGCSAFMAVPVLNGKGECIGVAIADNRTRSAGISVEQRRLLDAFSAQAGIAIDNALLYERTQSDFLKIRRLTEYTENVLLSIPAGIVSTDAEGRILRSNSAADYALLRTRGTLRGLLLSVVLKKLHVPKHEANRLLELFAQVLETGESVYQYKLTPRYSGTDRMQKTLRVNLSRLSYHDEPNGIVISIEDVTQEEALVAQLESVRRLADIGQLAAKMAHEVRNALSPIKAAAQFIRDEMRSNGSDPDLLWPEMIIAEVDGLSSLTGAMLDYSRPIPIDSRRVAPSDLLAGCIASLAPFMAEHHVQIEWELGDDIPDLIADPVQLGQAVRNIIMNAAQSMESGGTIRIMAEFNRREQMVAIGFADSGPGIAIQDLDQIFQPFVTTKPKGTGLGLSIVRKIASAHGGRVEVENMPEGGAKFTLLLPLAPPVLRIAANISAVSPVISPLSGGFEGT